MRVGSACRTLPHDARWLGLSSVTTRGLSDWVIVWAALGAENAGRGGVIVRVSSV